MTKFLSFSILSFVLISQIACDPCTLLPNVGSTYFGKPEDVLKCFKSIPLDSSESLEVVDSLKGLVKLYSFTDIAKSPPSPYTRTPVNLEVELQSIDRRVRSSSYSGDYDFQTDVLKAFNSLSDAHTLYRLPQSYSSCFYIRPYDIEAIYDKNTETQVFYLRPGPLGDRSVELWKKTFNFNIQEHLGQQVISFDSMTPLSYFFKFASKNIGFYKDDNVKVNAALRKRWAQTTLSMFPLEDSSLNFNLQVLLGNGKRVTIPNAVLCNTGYENIADFVAKNKRDAKVTKKEDIHLEEVKKQVLFGNMDIYKELDMIHEEKSNGLYAFSEPHIDDVSNIIKQVNGIKIPLAKKTVRVSGSNLKLVRTDSSANDASYMMLVDSEDRKVPVYKLSSFLPTYGTYYVLDLFNQMLKDAERDGHKEVVIDVSFNGGGILCLADLYAALLIEEWGNMSSSNPNAPLGVYDFRKSELTDSFSTNYILGSLFTNPLFYLSLKDRQPYYDFTWYTPGVNHTRGGSTSNYASKVHFASICLDFPTEFDNPSFEPYRYFFDKVTVVTDGTCGSACSLFVTLLQSMKNKVSVVSYGGLYNYTIPMDTSSFAGGNVLEWGLISTLTEFFGEGPNMPKRFPTNAGARFNYHEYYPFESSKTPREYLKYDADYHIHQWAAIHNTDINTQAGRQALANLYATAALIGRHTP